MRKVLKTLGCLLLAFTLVNTTSIANVKIEATSDEMSTYLSNFDKLYDASQEYMTANGVAEDTANYKGGKSNWEPYNYLRLLKYPSGGNWDVICGRDNGFVTYIQTNYKDLDDYFKGLTSKTVDGIDMLHMAAAEAGYLYEGKYLGLIVLDDMMSWGGDLSTLTIEMKAALGESATASEYEEWIANNIGKANNTFSEEDVFADLDAYNIANLVSATNSSKSAMRSYYETNTLNNVEKRVSNFIGNKTKDNITSNASSALAIYNLVYSSGFTADQQTGAANGFADYLFKNQEFTITLSDGTTSKQEVVKNQDVVSSDFLNSLNKTGYKASFDKDTTTPITADTTFNVTLTPITYKVSLTSSDDHVSGTSTSQDMTYDTPSNLKDNPFTRAGYTFKGWEYQGQTYADKASVSNLTTKDGEVIKLVAKWEAKTYKVNFDSVGGSNKDSVTTSFYKNIVLPNSPTKDGYKFDGWYYNNQKITSTDAYNELVSNNDTISEITLVAKYRALSPTTPNTKKPNNNNKKVVVNTGDSSNGVMLLLLVSISSLVLIKRRKAIK